MHGVPPVAYRSQARAVAAFAEGANTMTAVAAITAPVEIMAAISRRPTFLLTVLAPFVERRQRRRRIVSVNILCRGSVPVPPAARPPGGGGQPASVRPRRGSAVAGRHDARLDGVLGRVGRVAGDHGALVERAGALVRAAVGLAAVSAATQHDGALLLHRA